MTSLRSHNLSDSAEIKSSLLTTQASFYHTTPKTNIPPSVPEFLFHQSPIRTFLKLVQ